MGLHFGIVMDAFRIATLRVAAFWRAATTPRRVYLDALKAVRAAETLARSQVLVWAHRRAAAIQADHACVAQIDAALEAPIVRNTASRNAKRTIDDARAGAFVRLAARPARTGPRVSRVRPRAPLDAPTSAMLIARLRDRLRRLADIVTMSDDLIAPQIERLGWRIARMTRKLERALARISAAPTPAPSPSPSPSPSPTGGRPPGADAPENAPEPAPARALDSS